MKRNIPYGVYLYSYAMTAAAEQSEIAHTLRLIKGKSISCGTYIDMEDADNYKKNHGGIPCKQVNTDIVKAFCNAIPGSGFYCNKDWHSNYLIPTQLQGYKFWYARPDLTAPDLVCDFWQNKIDTNARWPGVAGPCDNDIGYLQITNINKPAGPIGVYLVAQGDTLGNIAAKFNTTVKVLQELNNLSNTNIIYANQILRIAKRICQVQPGDTLAVISKFTKIDVNTLVKINNLVDANKIWPGQLLIIEL
jgi:LysM repeat protein